MSEIDPNEIAHEIYQCVSITRLGDAIEVDFRDVLATKIVRAALAAENEACARIADGYRSADDPMGRDIATAIRARMKEGSND